MDKTDLVLRGLPKFYSRTSSTIPTNYPLKLAKLPVSGDMRQTIIPPSKNMLHPAVGSMSGGNISITQALVDGDFSHNTWSAVNGTTSVANNIGIATGNGADSIITLCKPTTLTRHGQRHFVKGSCCVTDSSCTQLITIIGGGKTSIVASNPVANQWYDFYYVYTASTQNDTFLFDIRATYPNATTQNGKVLQAKLCECIDMGTDTSSLLYNLSANIILSNIQRAGYFSGSKNIDIYGIIGGTNASQLITNGNFANEATGWTTSGGTASTSGTTITVTGNGTSATPHISHAVTLTAGRKYFCIFTGKVDNSSCSRIIMVTNNGTALATKNTPSANQYYTASLIYSPASNMSSIQIWEQYADSTTANGKTMSIQNVMIIDMGADTSNKLFNLSNDVMLAAVNHTGYFDGTSLFGGLNINVDTDGTITIDGVQIDSSNIYKIYPKLFCNDTDNSANVFAILTASTSYTFSKTIVSGTGSSSAIYVSSTTSSKTIFNTPSNTYTFTTDAVDNLWKIYLWIVDGYAFSNFKVRLQLEQGSVATAWEQYFEGSPSFNHPALITGVSDINVDGINYNLSHILYGDDTIRDTLDRVTNAGIIKWLRKVFDGTEDWSFRDDITDYNCTKLNSYTTGEFIPISKYHCTHFVPNSNTTTSGAPAVISDAPADSIIRCVVHGAASGTVWSHGKNLLSLPALTNTQQGITIASDGTGTILCTGQSDSTTQVWFKFNLLVPVLVTSDTVILPDISTLLQYKIEFYISDTMDGVMHSIGTNMPSAGTYLRSIYFTGKASLYSGGKTFYFCVSTSATPYEPYHGTSATIPTLASGDAYDVVSGTGKTAAGADITGTPTPMLNPAGTFTVTADSATVDVTTSSMALNSLDLIDASGYGYQFNLDKTIFPTLDSWKAFLAAQYAADTPVTVYQLVIPITITDTPTDIYNNASAVNVTDNLGNKYQYAISDLLDPTRNYSKLYAIISSIVTELNTIQVSIDKVQDMQGVNETAGDELYYRWGSLLSIPRLANESDDNYRARLKLSVTQLVGGTAHVLQYSIAVGLGINNDDAAIQNRIHIYDAWDYTGEIPHRDNGYVVALVDLCNQVYTGDFQTIVANAVNQVKAAGINVQIVFINFRIYHYIEFDGMTYNNLDTLVYNQIGE